MWLALYVYIGHEQIVRELHTSLRLIDAVRKTVLFVIIYCTYSPIHSQNWVALFELPRLITTPAIRTLP